MSTVKFIMLPPPRIGSRISYVDCSNARDQMGSNYKAGLHTINITGRMVGVRCDEDGWTVMQARGQYGNPATFFYRGWKDYVEGFGDIGTMFESA